MVRERREMFRALPPDHVGHESTVRVLDAVERWVAALAERHGHVLDPAIAVRAVFLCVTSMAMLEEDLLPGRDREEIIDELSRVLLRGVAAR
jgi:hypothetical protein